MNPNTTSTVFSSRAGKDKISGEIIRPQVLNFMRGWKGKVKVKGAGRKRGRKEREGEEPKNGANFPLFKWLTQNSVLFNWATISNNSEKCKHGKMAGRKSERIQVFLSMENGGFCFSPHFLLLLFSLSLTSPPGDKSAGNSVCLKEETARVESFPLSLKTAFDSQKNIHLSAYCCATFTL